MAHFEQSVRGDVAQFLAHLDAAITSGSVTASRESVTSQSVGEAQMDVLVYERYSAFGGNRVSLCISVLSVGDQMAVSAVTAGGSQAVFWKLNTVGEKSFLDKAVAAIQSFPG